MGIIVTLKNVTIMKKINSFILFGAAVFTFAACSVDSQEEFTPKNNKPVYETLSVKVGTEPTTRVSLATDATTATFETGDMIAVWTEAGSFQPCAVDGSGKITVDITSGVRSNYAVYYTGAAPTFESSTLKITLPDTYAYADVSGDKNPVPMVAKNVGGDAEDMKFYAVCGLARITLTGIPATATKLIASFSHDVTGEFTVTNPGTTAPYISAAAKDTKNEITINLTPLTDYTGAVINLPVPVGTGISIQIDAYNGSDNLQSQTLVVDTWNAARAHGKKATCIFTPSMASMILAPGNLYTDGSGNLLMADKYYEHIYKNEGNFANDASWNINDRTHFNFNELYCLMKDEALDRSKAYTNQGSFEDAEKTFSGENWRVPTQADWTAMTTGARPGATFTYSDGRVTASTTGWKFVKAVVYNMSSAGTSSQFGTDALDPNAAGPSTPSQAGLLIFPDNVEITLAGGSEPNPDTKNKVDAANDALYLSKYYFDDLIGQGCAFLPSVGRQASGSFGQVGIGGYYWSSTQSNGSNGYWFLFNDSQVEMGSSGKSIFRSVRLVRDLE